MRALWPAAAGLAASGSPIVMPAPGEGLIGRQAARELARRELSKSIYQPSVAERIARWLARLYHDASLAVPGGWWSAVALTIALVLVITAVLFWVRPARARKSASSAVLPGKARDAADYRRAARELAEAGDYSAAIVERVRAIAAGLSERGIVPARPGRTAHELGEEAAAELPASAAELRAVMRLFEDVRYGDRPGTQPGYLRVSHLDAELRAARPARAAAPALLPGGSRAGP